MNNNLFDVWVMFGFGLLGYILERLRVPLPPLILGLVLGPILEGNLRKMIGTFGDVTPLFTHPIALSFILMAVASVAFSVFGQFFQAKADRKKVGARESVQ